MNLRVNDPNLTWVHHSSSPKTGESTTAPNSKVDSLVTEEDEVTGPAISEKNRKRTQQHTCEWSK